MLGAQQRTKQPTSLHPCVTIAKHGRSPPRTWRDSNCSHMSWNPSSNVCKRCYDGEPHFSRQGSRGTERLSKPGKDHTAKDSNPRHLAPEPTVLANRYAVLLCLCHPSVTPRCRQRTASSDGEGINPRRRGDSWNGPRG